MLVLLLVICSSTLGRILGTDHSSAQCVLCKVYFSAQPNKLRPILKFEKYYSIEQCSMSENGHFWPKVTKKNGTSSGQFKNSKTTFIVQTFPKNGPYGFDLVNLSLLGAILAKFGICLFSGLFWPFFPCKWGQTRKSFPERQFLVYNAEIFFVNSYNPCHCSVTVVIVS